MWTVTGVCLWVLLMPVWWRRLLWRSVTEPVLLMRLCRWVASHFARQFLSFFTLRWAGLVVLEKEAAPDGF